MAPLAVSPNGHRIAFVAKSTDGKTLLWVRTLDTLAAQPLLGTDDASSPFWSPDSRFLGFFAGGKLKKIEVSGGPPITLCDAPRNRGGTWGRDGMIVLNPATYSPLQKVSASGGVPTSATTLGQGETWHVAPFFLPDGRHFLYSAGPAGSEGPIYLASLDSTERQLLLKASSSNVVYTEGYLLFLRETTLMAQPFDPARLTLAGDPFPITEQIDPQLTNTPPYGVFSASQNGVLAYATGFGRTGTLVWFDRAGREIKALGDPAAYSDLELSPDGKRASVSMPDQAGKARDIWLYDLDRGLRTRFTFDQEYEWDSIWSPDDTRVVFSSNRKGHLDLYQKSSSGAGTEELLLADNLDKAPTSWSPDGRFILYTTRADPETGADLWVLPLSGDRKAFPFLKTQFNEAEGQFSPDGRWVAYQSSESGRTEVYVTPFPALGGKWQISTGGGTHPRWRRDGSEIYYLAPDNRLMVATVNAKGSSFELDVVKPLFETRATGTGTGDTYDVSADGQRFLIISTPEQNASVPITVVINWTAGLKK